MYEKNKTQRVTLRLSEEQFEYVKGNADLLGVSPSDFLRMVINATMAMSKAACDAASAKLEEAEQREREGAGRENDKTDSDNIV